MVEKLSFNQKSSFSLLRRSALFQNLGDSKMETPITPQVTAKISFMGSKWRNSETEAIACNICYVQRQMDLEKGLQESLCSSSYWYWKRSPWSLSEWRKTCLEYFCTLGVWLPCKKRWPLRSNWKIPECDTSINGLVYGAGADLIHPQGVSYTADTFFLCE